jgi:hypothetical protein
MSLTECYPTKAPQIDDLLETLSDDVRRHIINYFETDTNDTVASLAELVAYIADRIPHQTAEKLSTTLPHHHLPLLAARGWIEFDRRTEVVRYTGNDDAERLLADVRDIFVN